MWYMMKADWSSFSGTLQTGKGANCVCENTMLGHFGLFHKTDFDSFHKTSFDPFHKTSSGLELTLK